ncbi:protein draper-like [Saccostrea cucullata]|uniref:protein draper-like n=1 Tax=Saccostrea cuccullata TaxID=36930 RepID=UPI002ED15909
MRSFYLCYWTFVVPRLFCNEVRSGENALECTEVKNGTSKCCADYIWKSNSNKCEKCNPGYVGIKCSDQCPKGFYGDGCYYKCHSECSECHYVTGECFTSTTDAVTENKTEVTLSAFTQLRLEKSTKKDIWTTIIITVGSMVIFLLVCFLLIHLHKLFKQKRLFEVTHNTEQFMNGQSVPVYEQINESNMLRNTIVLEIHDDISPVE